MRLEVHHHHHDPAVERQLDRIATALFQKMEQIMSAITDYAAKVTAFYNQISAALDDAQKEIKSLNDKIAQLQNNPGPISDADQAVLDAAQAQAHGLVQKVQALDTINRPAAPPAS